MDHEVNVGSYPAISYLTRRHFSYLFLPYSERNEYSQYRKNEPFSLVFLFTHVYTNIFECPPPTLAFWKCFYENEIEPEIQGNPVSFKLIIGVLFRAGKLKFDDVFTIFREYLKNHWTNTRLGLIHLNAFYILNPYMAMTF